MLSKWLFGPKQKQTTQRPRRRRLGVECLERRDLLSATPILDLSGIRSLGDTSATYILHRELDASCNVTTSNLDITGSFGSLATPATFHLHVVGGNGNFTTTVDETGTALFVARTLSVGADDAWLDGYLGAIQSAVALHPLGTAGAGGESVNSITVGPDGLSATVVQTIDNTTRTLALDDAGRTLSDTYTNATTGQILQSSAFTYDDRGRILTGIQGDRTTGWTYDDAGHRTSETLSYGTPQAATTQFVYAGDNVVAVIDPVGNTTSYGYDDQNRVISVTDGCDLSHA